MPIASEAEDQRVLLLDTSTALALILEDHDRHEAVLAAVRGNRLGLAGHAWFETYSVLTRLPSGRRMSPGDAVRLLRHNFGDSRFLDVVDAERLALELGERGITGGAVYDALVAAAARQHGAMLLTADQRARPTYDAMGVTVSVVR
jgi:predicted nucleic acid-binding protein